jgi:hypothetical protein
MQKIVRECYQKDEIQLIHIDQECCCETEMIHARWRMYEKDY